VHDLGAPIAYLALEEGMPVYDARGERIGVLEHVVGDVNADIFDGVVVHTHPLPGRHLFADVEQIAELRERGVVLAVGRDALHDPGARSRARDGAAGTAGESAFDARVRRAWDRLSGRA
jgi:uncharacterized protein YrrD